MELEVSRFLWLTSHSLLFSQRQRQKLLKLKNENLLEVETALGSSSTFSICPPHPPLCHDEVAVHRRSQSDVDAADGVDVPEDQQHGPRHGLQHLHDAVEAADGHVAHVGRLLSVQDVGQAQLVHVDGSLQQHLTEQEVLYTEQKTCRVSPHIQATSPQGKDLLTCDSQGVGVLLHGGLVPQDYGPPQFTQRLSVPGVKGHAQSALQHAHPRRCMSILPLLKVFVQAVVQKHQLSFFVRTTSDKNCRGGGEQHGYEQTKAFHRSLLIRCSPSSESRQSSRSLRPTVSWMRVGVDEPRVKDLLCKRSDEFICSLRSKRAF